MPAHGFVSSRSKVLADRRWRPVSPSMSQAPRLTSPLSMATHISNPTPRSSFLPACPAGPGRRIFLLLPRRVRDWAYDRIARNRYRLFGRNESCLVPTSAIAARFVLDDPSEERP